MKDKDVKKMNLNTFEETNSIIMYTFSANT